MTWPTRRIDDIAIFLNARRVPVKAADRAKRQGAYPYYGASGIVDWVDGFIFDGEYLLISEDGENLRSRNTPIAFLARGKYWVNNHAHILDEREPGILRYLSWALNRTDLSPYITGAAQPKLNKRTLAEMEIAIPPEAERLRINALLGALDDKIELNRRMSATLEEMARALYRSWFVDFDPVHARALGQPPVHIDPTTAALFPDSFGEDGLPKGWRRGMFGQSVEIISGGTPKTSVAEYWGGDIPWYSVVEAPDLGAIFVLDTEKKITISGFEGCAAKMVDKGTTIISARGTVGKLAMAAGPMVFNQSCYGLSGSRANMSEFVYFGTLRAVELLQSMSHGSVFSTITRKTFDGLELVQPSDQVMSAFADQAGLYLNKILAAQRENITLGNLRDTLLPRLMSGELRIREAEKQVEVVI